jgi:formyltetrahydrofolate hydrolase
MICNMTGNRRWDSGRGIVAKIEVEPMARAVTWHAEHRVLLNEDRTVVFH